MLAIEKQILAKPITSIMDTKCIIIDVLSDISPLGYLSGPITSDGPEKINENLKLLRYKSKELRDRSKFVILSAPDIISIKIYTQINGNALSNSDWEDFWSDLLSSGVFSDIYMMNGWQRSRGCAIEHSIAIKRNLKIHYL